MNATNSPERLVFFSDAVTAIALTLLVLPLTEVVRELVATHSAGIQAITENQWQIFSFLLSFAVISRFWLAHHRLFADVQAYNRPLMTVNLCWLLTIAVLPFPTEMVGAFGTDRFTVLFYLGTIGVGSLCQTVMLLIIRHDPGVRREGATISRQRCMVAVGSTLSVMVAFVIALFVPEVGYFALLLLAIPPLIARWRYPAEAV